MSKVCTKCGVEKDESEFYSKGVRRGVKRLRSACKNCESCEQKSRRFLFNTPRGSTHFDVGDSAVRRRKFYKRKQIEGLTFGYVKSKSRLPKLAPEGYVQAFVSVKRVQIQIHRFINQK